MTRISIGKFEIHLYNIKKMHILKRRNITFIIGFFCLISFRNQERKKCFDQRIRNLFLDNGNILSVSLKVFFAIFFIWISKVNPS